MTDQAPRWYSRPPEQPRPEQPEDYSRPDTTPGYEGAYGRDGFGVDYSTTPEYRGAYGQQSGPMYDQRGSYWERPENIAGAYNDILLGPGNDWAAFGIDRDFVVEAHDYLAQANQGKSWWDWQPLDETDPFNERLRSMGEPAPEYQHSQVYKPDYMRAQPDQPPPLPGGADLENLTGWQRTMAFLQSNGTLQGITNMLPWMAIGGATGFVAGGPIGGILGAGGAMIAGGIMGWAGDPETQEAARARMLRAGYDPKTVDFLFNVGNSALRYLNLPAEKLEQTIGTTAQLGEAWLPSVPYRLLGYQSMYDEYVQSQADVQALINNLPAVWESSRLTYEAAATTGGVAGGITHAPAGIEWLIDMALHGSTDVDFAGIGEVYTLTSPDPVKLDMFGAALLAAARNEIKAGANPMQIIEKYQKMTGFSGQFADLMYQSFADPFYVMPIAERGVVKAVGKVTHNPVLELASGMAKGEGAIGTFRSYGELLRQGVEGAPLPQNMTRFQRYVANVTPEGVYRELQPGAAGTANRVKRGLLGFAESPLNPMQWWRSISELTPKSKYAMFTGMAQGNLGNLIRHYDGDVDTTVRDIAAITERTPAELRVAGSHLGNAEIYTIRQGLAGYNDKLKQRYSRWQMTEGTRQRIAQIASATGEDYNTVVKELTSGDAAANNLYRRTVAKLEGTDSPLLRDPTFSVNGLKQSAAILKDTPWVSDPGFFQAALYQDITNHLEKWAVQAYGVKPEAALFRGNAVLKATQSLLLLDFNPAYLVNNVVNNAVTMAAEGVGGFVGPTDITRYLDWIGRDLGAKASEGIGMAGEGGKPIRQQYDTFEQAYQEGGWDAAIAWASADAANIGTDAAKVNDWISKLKNKIPAGPMRAWSGKMESTQSVIAHYNGTMQAWSRMWRRNGTIPQMPQELRANLARIDPRLPDLITAGIEKSRTKGDLNSMIAGLDKLQRQADPYVESVARALKIDSPLMREMLTQTNVIEKMNGYLDQGLSVDDAVNAVAREMNQVSKEYLRERQQVAAQQGGALMRAEGMAGGVGAMRDMAWGRDEFWTRMFRENESAFTAARDMLAPDRRKFMDEHFRIQNEEWRIQKAHEEATMYGFLREAGFTDPQARDALSLNAKKFMGDMVGMNARWDKYYQLRERRVKKFMKDSANSSPDESGRLWAETQKELGIAYDQFAQAELDTVKRMGQTFLDMYQEQFGGKGIEGAAYWWRGIYETSRKRIELMKDMRAWERGEGLEAIRDNTLKSVLSEFSPDNRHAAWPKFSEKVYLPAIGEITQAHLDGVKAFSDGATGRVLPEDYADAMKFFEREAGADPVADVQASVVAVEETAPSLRKWAMRNVASYDELPKSLKEIYSGSAAMILDELRTAAGGRKSTSIKVRNEAGGFDVIAQPGHRGLEWWSDLYAQGYKSKRSLENALAKIADNKNPGHGVYADLARRLVEGRLEAGSFGMPSSPAWLLNKGDIQGAAKAFGEWMDMAADEGVDFQRVMMDELGGDTRAYEQLLDAWEKQQEPTTPTEPTAPIESGAKEVWQMTRKDFFHPQYNRDAIDHFEAAKSGDIVGTVGDFIKGEKTRAALADVLNIPVMRLDTPVQKGKEVTPIEGVEYKGASGTYRGERTIFIKYTQDFLSTLLEEAAHELRVKRGRQMTKQDITTSEGIKARESLTEEISADRFVKYLRSLAGQELTHEQIVRRAVSEGKPVPPEVLADYPDLAPVKIESGQPVPIEQATDTTATPRTLDDIYTPSLKQEGWTRGKKGLLNAVNADRQAQGLEPYASAKDVPWEEGMAAMRKRVPAQEKPPDPADLPAAKEPRPAVTVQRYLEPHVMGDMPIIGAAYVNGKFAAYIPYRFETNKVFTTAEGNARLLGVDPDGQWVYRIESTGEVKTLADGDENIPVAGPYLPGTLESHGGMEPDQSNLYREGFGMWVRPVLDELARQMKQGAPIGGDLANLDDAGVRQLRQYIEQVGNEMSATKRAAVRFGDMKRDFTLLDYNKRYGFDNMFGLVFPYQFWFTRSMVNWSLRFADRPGMLAAFARLSQFTNEELDDKYKVIPSRLKNKVRIPVPFLESYAPWTGGNIYVDPWGKLFPFREFLRPWESYLGDQNRVRRKAEQYLDEWVRNEEISNEEATQAAETMSGALWDKAMAVAQDAEGGDVVDFMSVMSSPSLAISMLVRGPDKTGPFPLSRLLQGLTAVTGWDGLAGLDVEANLRKQAKLSEFGEWGNYYIDRQLANLAYDGMITAQDAQIAMIERTGPAYDMALDRVRMETALRQPGMLPLLAARNALQGDGNILDILGSALISWLPGGLLPEGELGQRGLKAEYDAARRAFYEEGDKEAFDNFFEEHPEYKARLAMWDEPEERLQKFLVNEIKGGYYDLPEPMQNQFEREAGQDFFDYLINSETRDYDAISLERLSQWSQLLGGYRAQGTGYAEALDFPAPDAATEYQQLKDQMFPGIGAIMSQYYNATPEQKALIKQQNPQIQAYQNWKDTYLAHNPELIPYMISEDSELAQADPETAYMVYMYRAEKARLFPEISGLLDQYYTLEGGARKTFGKQNPMIYAYLDWERQMLAQSPQIARYVKSDASAFKIMYGDDYVKEYGTPVNVYQWPAEMQSQMQAYFGRNIPLGSGAKDYAYLQWERSGRPFGSFTTWLKSLGVFYGAVQ